MYSYKTTLLILYFYISKTPEFCTYVKKSKSRAITAQLYKNN